MRFCEASNCGQPVFGTCKKSGKGYCKSHQTMREDFDGRSIVQKAMAKQSLKGKVRGLHQVQDKGQSSLASLIHDLDTVFSQYIRIKDADKNGMVKCFCCPLVLHWTLAENSHYIKRGHQAVRFSTSNCKPSCKKCNSNHNDNIEPYRSLLIKEHGIGEVEWLEEQSAVVYKPTQDELKEQLIDIREKLRIVKLKLEK
jgi:hypothetical protein